MSSRIASAFGRVRGRVVELEAPVPELEGQRVRVEAVAAVAVTSEDPTAKLTQEDNARLLAEWARSGPDGPISDEDAGVD